MDAQERDLIQQHNEWVATTRRLEHNARKYSAARRQEASRRRRRLTNNSLREYCSAINHAPKHAPRKIRGAKPVRAKSVLDLEITYGVKLDGMAQPHHRLRAS